jgi:3-oxoadipate enol-lactonase
MLIETRRCGTLWVDVQGNGPPIVFWPSVFCDGAMWSTIPARFARAYRTIVIDPPGHGRSSRIREPYTMEDCVDAAISVLDRLGIARAHWCGLSWGGMVGMRLALRQPDRVASLVLIDTNADVESRDKLPAYRVLALFARLVGRSPRLLDRLEPIFFSPRTIRENRPIVDAFRRHVTAMDRESVNRVLDAVIFGRDDVRAKLPQIGAPTLVIVGRDDVATPRARSEDIRARIRGADLVEIPDAGHLSAWERPDAVGEAIERFLPKA